MIANYYIINGEKNKAILHTKIYLPEKNSAFWHI